MTDTENKEEILPIDNPSEVEDFSEDTTDVEADVDIDTEAADVEEDTELESLTPEEQDRYQALQDEFGEDLTDLIVDTEFDKEVAEFLLVAEQRLKEVQETYGDKVSFYMHRDPGPRKDHYILRTLAPSEWNANWLSIMSGTSEAMEMYLDDLLEACMVYPSFEETAWEWENDKLHAPDGLTKGRLAGKFFDMVLPDRNTATGVAFGSQEVSKAVDVAKRRRKPKPGL